MTHISVVECEIPENSEVFRFIENATFCDCYSTGTESELSPLAVYWSIFGHTPSWIQSLMAARNKIAALVGLRHHTAAEMKAARDSVHHANLEVGQRAGLFSVLYISDNELVLGDDDKHLNFRISVLTEAGKNSKAYVTTVVSEHNFLGRIYMVIVKPIHRVIAPYMIRKAIRTRKLK